MPFDNIGFNERDSYESAAAEGVEEERKNRRAMTES